MTTGSAVASVSSDGTRDRQVSQLPAGVKVYLLQRGEQRGEDHLEPGREPVPPKASPGPAEQPRAAGPRAPTRSGYRRASWVESWGRVSPLRGSVCGSKREGPLTLRSNADVASNADGI